jgi:nucleotide-binding universal stress UspA family protein
MTGMATEPEARIVVGVDGSANSVDALRWAARLAPMLKCEVEAVTAWFDPRSSGWSPGWGFLSSDVDPAENADKVLTTALENAFGGDRPDGLRPVVEKGSAAKVLIDRSAGAQMLVVGSRGHGGFAGLLLGSVSSKCAEHARCPVLVVHGTTAGPATA